MVKTAQSLMLMSVKCGDLFSCWENYVRKLQDLNPMTRMHSKRLHLINEDVPMKAQLVQTFIQFSTVLCKVNACC